MSQFLISSGDQFVGAGIQFFTFPGGERHVRLPELKDSGSLPWRLTAVLDDATGVVDLMLLVDAMRNQVGSLVAIHLVMPYVPYARQDRVAVKGEAFSARVFCKLINSMDFESVTITDPHSDVVTGLLDRVIVRTVADEIPSVLQVSGYVDLLESAVLVAPDAGSVNRVAQAARAIAGARQSGTSPQVIQATKTRDPVTGKLAEPSVPEGIPTGQPLLIVDDICDGGGTFIQLAQVLKQHTDAPLYLYVTHGIFSKGLQPLHEHFRAVFCPHPFIAVAQEFTSKASASCFYRTY